MKMSWPYRAAWLVALTLGAFGILLHYTASVSAQIRPRWEYRLINAGGLETNPDGTYENRQLSRLGADDGRPSA
jgi:hypothetical protein